MVRIGACVVHVAVFSTVVFILVQTNVTRYAFLIFTITPQYITLIAFICPGPIL